MGIRRLPFESPARIVAVLLILLPGALFSEETAPFRMQFAKDDVLIVRKEQEILLGRGREESREEKNRIVLKAGETTEDGSTLDGSFLTYFRTPAGSGPFQRDREFISRFQILKNGQYDVPDEYVMPNLRSIPSFPDRPLKPGDVWDAPALETIDLPGLKIKIPLSVRYKYVGPETVKDYYGKERSAHRILFVYELNHRVVPGQGPVRIIQGQSTGEIWFSSEENIPIRDVQTIRYRFLLSEGRKSESAYRIRSWYEKIRRTTPEEKKEMGEDIRKKLEGGESHPVQVRETDQGISLDLNNVLFDVDSDQLKPEAEKTLDRIAEILGKYPDREIRIQGHTDSTGSSNHNRDLSTRRARSVLEYLLSKGLNAERMSYKGFGESNPVAPNETEEGRAKNRRVEVLIVTE